MCVHVCVRVCDDVEAAESGLARFLEKGEQEHTIPERRKRAK